MKEAVTMKLEVHILKCLSADDAARPLAFDFRAVVKVLDGWRDFLRGESKSVVAERSKKSRYHHG